MSESKTPESDRAATVAYPYANLGLVHQGFARTLETQRDEARAEVERLRKRVEELEADQDYHVDMQTGNFHPDTPTQPEIFEAHGLEWYKHTPGDKMPCDGEMMVKAVMRGGDLAYCGDSVNASYLEWGLMFYREYDVTGWRPADAPEKLPRK